VSHKTIKQESAGSLSVPCPKCGHAVSAVIDTRPRATGQPRRRRQCLKCQERFTTREMLETDFEAIEEFREQIGVAHRSLIEATALVVRLRATIRRSDEKEKV